MSAKDVDFYNIRTMRNVLEAAKNVVSCVRGAIFKKEKKTLLVRSVSDANTIPLIMKIRVISDESLHILLLSGISPS